MVRLPLVVCGCLGARNKEADRLIHRGLGFSHTGEMKNFSHLLSGLGISKLPGSSMEAQPEGKRKRVVPLSPVNEFPCSSPSKLPVPGRAGPLSA